MKFKALALIVGSLVCVNAAQTQTNGQSNTQAGGQAAAQAQANDSVLPAGATFNAQLDSSLDSKKAKPGDTVKAQTTEPCKLNGKTILPEGAHLVGHVTEASARAKGQAGSSLGIVFDKAVLKNKEEIPLTAGVQAIAVGDSGTAAGGPELGGMTSASGNMGGATGGSGMGSSGQASGGTVASTVHNTTTPVVGAVSGATRSADGVDSPGAIGGLNAAGRLTGNSHGVFGLEGISLNSAATSNAGESLITSTGKNVHLDSGTKLLLVAQAGGSAGPNASKERPRSESQRQNNKE
jgi:hypothetical protein